MQITNSYILAAGCVFLVLTAVFVIGHAGRRLAERNASDIRIVWYFFSLSLTSTLLIAWWASSVGAIDVTGSFHGTAGSVLHRLLDVMLDLETDLKVLFGLAALVIALNFSAIFSAAHLDVQPRPSWSDRRSDSSSGAW